MYTLSHSPLHKGVLERGLEGIPQWNTMTKMIPIQLDTHAQKTDPSKVKIILPQGMGCQVTFWMLLPGQIQTQELLSSSGLCSTKKRFPVLREANRVVERNIKGLQSLSFRKILTLTKVVTWPAITVNS